MGRNISTSVYPISYSTLHSVAFGDRAVDSVTRIRSSETDVPIDGHELFVIVGQLVKQSLLMHWHDPIYHMNHM